MASHDLAGYRLTPAARDDLEAIWLYSAHTWSVAQADRYIDSLQDTFERLVTMPELARERPEFNPPIRAHPSAEHVVIYHIQAEVLVVLRVLGGRQNWQALLHRLDQG